MWSSSASMTLLSRSVSMLRFLPVVVLGLRHGGRADGPTVKYQVSVTS